MAAFAKTAGTYGIVEPNHLSAQRTGQIYAQLPAAAAITVLENGQFVKYDMAAGVCNFVGAGEWMLVMNEIKLYEPRQTLKDFAMKKVDAYNGEMTPRVYKTNIGDIFTTTMVKDGPIVVGDKMIVGTAGVLEVKAIPVAADGIQWLVVKLTTAPDAITPAVKLQRIA